MICPHCGTELPDNALFCAECGARLDGQPGQPDQYGQPGQYDQYEQYDQPVIETPYVPGRTYDEAAYGAPKKKQHLVIGIVIAVVVATLLLAITVVSCTALALAARSKSSVDSGPTGPTPSVIDNGTHPVTFMVNISNYDTDSSRIPVRITGTDSDGNDVDETIYLAYSGVDVELPEGEYEAEVLGSPIASDGTIYEYPTEKISFSLSGLSANESFKMSRDQVFDFVPIDPADVTDEQVEDALEWARKDEESGVDVGELEKAIKKNRMGSTNDA